MVETIVVKQLYERPGGTRLGIGGGEYDLRDSGEQNCSRTHRAGLKGHVECGLVKSPIPHRGRGLGDGDHLGVGGWVPECMALIVGGGNHPALADDHRAHGHLVGRERVFRFRHGQTHVPFVKGVVQGKAFQASSDRP